MLKQENRTYPVSARLVGEDLFPRVKRLFPSLSDETINTRVAFFRGGNSLDAVNTSISRVKAAGVEIDCGDKIGIFGVEQDGIRRISAYKGEEFPSLCILMINPVPKETREKPGLNEINGESVRRIDPRYGLDWNEVKHDAIRDAARRMFGID